MTTNIINTAENLLQNKSDVPYTFNKIARRYDLATFFSQGYSKDLQRSVNLMQLKGDEYLLDLCCGTGKSTTCCLRSLPTGKVLAIDNSSEMLRVAEANLSHKFPENKCRFLEMDVMNLSMADNSVDAIFMAYGIRNMPDYEKCMKNLLRILKPGGVIGFHEFSLREGIFSRIYWRLIGYGLIIPFSALITGNLTIFRYLIKSVLNFLSPAEFTKMLTSVGFSEIAAHPQQSWRKLILYTFIAKKPQ